MIHSSPQPFHPPLLPTPPSAMSKQHTHTPHLILATEQPIPTPAPSTPTTEHATATTPTAPRTYKKVPPSFHLSPDHELPALYQNPSAASSVKSFILKTAAAVSGANTPNEHSAAAAAAAQGLGSEIGSGIEGYAGGAEEMSTTSTADIITAHLNDALQNSFLGGEKGRRANANAHMYKLESPTPSVISSSKRDSISDSRAFARLLADMDDGVTTTGSDVGSDGATGVIIEPFNQNPIDENSIQIAMSDTILHHRPGLHFPTSLSPPSRPFDSDSDASSSTSSPHLRPVSGARPIRVAPSKAHFAMSALPPPVVPEAGSELGSSVESGGSTESEGEKARRVAKLKRQGSRSSVKAKKGKEHRRKYSEEDPSTSTWTTHKKHFFILSSAGKPVWTRYGDESRISSLMGVIQAIVSFFADNDDSIRSINAGQHRFVFLLKDPLYFVAVARTGESESQLRDQLLYLYNQILSVLTGTQLTRIFEQRINFDLRRLLGGTEVFLDSLSTLFNHDHGFMLGAIQCQRVPRELRDRIGAVLAQGRAKDLLYAMIVANGKLVTLLRPRKHSLHPSDLHLLFNMLTGSTTFRSAESWTPLCLPKFNSKGFLHAYICYIERDVCLLMISTDKDRFFDLSEWKGRIVENLQTSGALEGLQRAVDETYTIADIGIASLRHFLYKSKMNVQFTCPDLVEPYTTADERRRLFRLYQHAHDRMHSRTRPLKLYYFNSENESMLGWITSSFELYVTFSPLISKSSIITSSNHLLRWIKKHEESLFVINSPVF